MNIYKISQKVNNNWDTYDSAIVCAETEEDAKRIYPGGFYEAGKDDHWFFNYSDGTKKDEGLCPEYSSWCAVKDVKVEYLGVAKDGIEKGVILASFNAG